MRLAGKVAVITGSGGGQGKAAAVLFAREGAKVVVNDLQDAAVGAVVDEIRVIVQDRPAELGGRRA